MFHYNKALSILYTRAVGHALARAGAWTSRYHHRCAQADRTFKLWPGYRASYWVITTASIDASTFGVFVALAFWEEVFRATPLFPRIRRKMPTCCDLLPSSSEEWASRKELQLQVLMLGLR
jgi:hypothetical protein